MLTNEAFNSSSNNDTLTEAEQLVCSIANVDPDLVLNHHEMWIDDPVRTDSKVYTNFHDHFYNQYCDFAPRAVYAFLRGSTRNFL